MGATRWLKLRAGGRKGADARTVTGGLILLGGREIKKIWVERSLEHISLSKLGLCDHPPEVGMPLDTSDPHIATFQMGRLGGIKKPYTLEKIGISS